MSGEKIDMYGKAYCKVFCGLRLIDGFGHVNNAKFLELFEFARWQHGMQSGFNQKFVDGKCYPVVAAAHVTYMAEVKPWSTVQIATQVKGSDEKFIYIEQSMYSKHPKTGKEVIHACALIKAALLRTKGKPKQLEPEPEQPVAKEGEPQPAKVRHPRALTVAQTLYRMGESTSVTEMPEKMVVLNKEFPKYLKLINEGDEGWRAALRSQKAKQVIPDVPKKE